MENKKIEKNRFSIRDYQLLFDYLDKKAAEGWLLTDYHEKTLEFTAMEPKKIRYDFCFYPDYVAGDTKISDSLQNMWDLALLDGWQHINGNYHIQFFYNEDENCAPLHTDATVLLEDYNRLIKKQYVKTWAAAAAIAAAALGLFVLWWAVVSAEYKATGYVTFALYAVSSIATVFVPFTFWESVYHIVKIIRYRRWYKKALRTAEDDNKFLPMKPKGTADTLNIIISILVIVVLLIQAATFAQFSFIKDVLEAVLNQTV